MSNNVQYELTCSALRGWWMCVARQASQYPCASAGSGPSAKGSAKTGTTTFWTHRPCESSIALPTAHLTLQYKIKSDKS